MQLQLIIPVSDRVFSGNLAKSADCMEQKRNSNLYVVYSGNESCLSDGVDRLYPQKQS